MEDHSSGRREVISVTDWCGMEGKSAQREQSHIVSVAAWLISVKRTVYHRINGIIDKDI